MPGTADKGTYAICMMHSVEKRGENGSEGLAQQAEARQVMPIAKEALKKSRLHAKIVAVFNMLNSSTAEAKGERKPPRKRFIRSKIG